MGQLFGGKTKKITNAQLNGVHLKKDTEYFDPSKKEFMFNYRVENLKELLETLKSEGVTIVGKMEEYDYGKFGWILDNEGNKIELWEPIDQAFK